MYEYVCMPAKYHFSHRVFEYFNDIDIAVVNFFSYKNIAHNHVINVKERKNKSTIMGITLRSLFF